MGRGLSVVGDLDKYKHNNNKHPDYHNHDNDNHFLNLHTYYNVHLTYYNNNHDQLVDVNHNNDGLPHRRGW